MSDVRQRKGPGPVVPSTPDAKQAKGPVTIPRPSPVVFAAVLIPMFVLTILATDFRRSYSAEIGPLLRSWVSTLPPDSWPAFAVQLHFPRCTPALFGPPQLLDVGIACVQRSIQLYVPPLPVCF